MSGKIGFFCEDISFKLKHKAKLRSWITAAAAVHDWTVGEINYIFCDDAYLLEINTKYLQHDTLTDIITFPLQEIEQQIKGEIYISIPRVLENAEKFGSTAETELHRVMIHGILHLLGFKDKSKEQKTLMRQGEDSCLLMLQNILSPEVD